MTGRVRAGQNLSPGVAAASLATAKTLASQEASQEANPAARAKAPTTSLSPIARNVMAGKIAQDSQIAEMTGHALASAGDAPPLKSAAPAWATQLFAPSAMRLRRPTWPLKNCMSKPTAKCLRT